MSHSAVKMTPEVGTVIFDAKKRMARNTSWDFEGITIILCQKTREWSYAYVVKATMGNMVHKANQIQVICADCSAKGVTTTLVFDDLRPEELAEVEEYAT